MGTPDQLKRGLRLPAICAPMFIISNPDLVIEQCKAGLIGSMPSLNARPQALLHEWLDRITGELAEHDARHPDNPAAPFAINLIVHSSNERLDEDLAACVHFRVPLVITSLGARPDVNAAIHGYGGLVFHDVINQSFARKAIDRGADGLILVANGAGGHAGIQSPFALVQETRRWFDGPIALAGAIANGRSILAAQTLGADFAYIGSAFIATTEANAAPGHKQLIVDSHADDIVYSNLFSGVHGNYLRGSIVAVGMDPANLPPGDPSKKGVPGSKPKAWRDVWSAGQGVGAIEAVVSTKELVGRLTREYREAKAALMESGWTS